MVTRRKITQTTISGINEVLNGRMCVKDLQRKLRLTGPGGYKWLHRLISAIKNKTRSWPPTQSDIEETDSNVSASSDADSENVPLYPPPHKDYKNVSYVLNKPENARVLHMLINR